MVPDVEPMLASQGVLAWHGDGWVEPSVGAYAPSTCRFAREDPVMVTRTILRNWLLFGIGMGVLGAVQVYIATERSNPALVMVGLGVLIGIVGGLGRFFIEWRRGGLGDEPERWTSIPLSRRLAGLVVASLAIGAGFARAAGAPVAVYVGIVAIAVVFSLLSYVVRRGA